MAHFSDTETIEDGFCPDCGRPTNKETERGERAYACIYCKKRYVRMSGWGYYTEKYTPEKEDDKNYYDNLLDELEQDFDW